jgi:thiamine kinase-like enzyme
MNLADYDALSFDCYGTLIDSDRQRYWLLLEKVAGDELYKIGVFSKWCDVARWLATMHGRLASMAERHQHDTVLLRYDEEFCHLWINRAEHFVGRSASAGQRQLTRAQIRKLADRCRQAVRSLCRLPVTIVHGEFYASNILIQQRRNQTRICPVDWEMAAIAPGLIDLAALIAGNWTQRQKQELARAYYDALAPEKAIYGSFGDLWSALRICRLLLAVKWLGWSADWRAPAEHRSDWLAEAMQLAHADDLDHA